MPPWPLERPLRPAYSLQLAGVGEEEREGTAARGELVVLCEYDGAARDHLGALLSAASAGGALCVGGPPGVKLAGEHGPELIGKFIGEPHVELLRQVSDLEAHDDRAVMVHTLYVPRHEAGGGGR